MLCPDVDKSGNFARNLCPLAGWSSLDGDGGADARLSGALARVLLREDADCDVDEAVATAAAKPFNLLKNVSFSNFT